MADAAGVSGGDFTKNGPFRGNCHLKKNKNALHFMVAGLSNKMRPRCQKSQEIDAKNSSR